VSDTPRTDAKAWGFRRQTVGATESAIEWAQELERENAKLKADAERLDWLDKEGRESGHGFCHVAYGDYRYYAHATYGGVVHPSARAAIDSARKGNTGGIDR